MLFLVGREDWTTLKRLVQDEVYDDVVSDNQKMASILAFAVKFQAPADILHFLCRLNPDALTVSDLPFRLARLPGGSASNMQTIIVLESARQQALINSFNGSFSSSLSLIEVPVAEQSPLKINADEHLTREIKHDSTMSWEKKPTLGHLHGSRCRSTPHLAQSA